MTISEETKAPAGSNLLKRMMIGAVIGLGVYAAFNWDTVSISIFGPAAYTCDNIVPQVVDIAEKNATTFNLKLIGIIDPSQVSRTETRLECKGQGMLSNGTKASVAYRAYEEGGQWWIFYEAAH